MIQYVLGFLVDDCAPMDTKITRNPCENNMLTNSNKAFYKFQLFLKWKGFEFYNTHQIANSQEKEYEQIMNLLLSEEAMSRQNVLD